MAARSPRAIGDLLASAIPHLGDRLSVVRIRQGWTATLGPDVARHAQPERLVDGCLQVVVDNSPWLAELTLRAGEVTGRLTARYPEIHAVKFRPGALEREPVPPRRREAAAIPLGPADFDEIDTALSAIADPELAAAARRLMIRARRFPSVRGAAR
jgi:hypothetical protein